LPHLAKSDNNTFWVIPGELTEAVRTVTSAFGGQSTASPPRPAQPEEAATADADDDASHGGRTAELEAGSKALPDAATAAEEAVKQAAAAVTDAKAEAEAAAAKSPQMPRRGQTSGAD
ncbi:hypothetical protein SSP35_41_00010, partial [Streptomyces sp. NBRC 110611]